mmetsp:Transcript_30963/g.62830  ORF Transcript_30963/g.62830 Transcript_30963/m.62830 type:complete len:90 (-) Transcript_30963:31-300(-)
MSSEGLGMTLRLHGDPSSSFEDACRPLINVTAAGLGIVDDGDRGKHVRMLSQWRAAMPGRDLSSILESPPSSVQFWSVSSLPIVVFEIL